MTTAELDNLMQRLEAGRLDDLSPEQVEALAAALDETPALDARLSSVATPQMSAALAEPIALPNDADWSRMFANIESATAAQSETQAGRPRVFRLWRVAAPFVAAAACVLAVNMFSSLSRPAHAELLALDADVQIESVEVGDGDSSMVLNSDDDDHFAVIWVVNDGPDSDSTPAADAGRGPTVGAPE